MNPILWGRSSLFLGITGLAAVAATFFVPTLYILSGLFSVVIVLLGLLGARTRAGRIGLVTALVALPIATFLAYRFGFEAREKASVPRSVQVCFSPNGGCADALVAQIAGAKKSVLVQAYSFTSRPIAEALVAAHRRGVMVRVLLCPSRLNESGNKATYVANAGVETGVDRQHKLAHNKVIIVDSEVVVTGSMNFTRGGETKNAENVVIVHDPALAGKYVANWGEHFSHSQPYAPDTTGALTDAASATDDGE